VPIPAKGRRFTTTRHVRMGDADTEGRLRLDALARLVQDVGTDDFVDAGVDPRAPWVTRRTAVVGSPWPRLGERLTFTTFCAGLGGRWAERRSSITGDRGGRVEIAALWVFIDERTGRPARLPEWFLSVYGESAGERLVSARMQLGRPPDTAATRLWSLRATDFDVLRHVNNASTWAAVEDECARAGITPGRADLEYGGAIEPGDLVELRSVPGANGELRVWLTVDGDVRAAASVVPLTP